MNDKTLYHLTQQEKLSLWKLFQTNGSLEQAQYNLQTIEGTIKEESQKELLRMISFCSLWQIVDTATNSFEYLLKNDTSGKIFILSSSLVSTWKGLLDSFILQFPIDECTKLTLLKKISDLFSIISNSISNEQLPQRSYKSPSLPFSFAPSEEEKKLLLVSHSLLLAFKKYPVGQSSVDHLLRYAKAFLARYNDAVPLFDMSIQSKEEDFILCQLINTALVAAAAKSVSVNGIQGCDEKKHPSHLAFSFSQSLEKDISAFLEAYTSW